MEGTKKMVRWGCDADRRPSVLLDASCLTRGVLAARPVPADRPPTLLRSQGISADRKKKLLAKLRAQATQ